ALPCARAEQTRNGASFEATNLGFDEGLTVVVGFPTGLVPTPRPILHERWSLGRAFAVTPGTVALAAGFLVLLLGGLGRLLWTSGRDRRAVGSPVGAAHGTSARRGEGHGPLFGPGAAPAPW